MFWIYKKEKQIELIKQEIKEKYETTINTEECLKLIVNNNNDYEYNYKIIKDHYIKKGKLITLNNYKKINKKKEDSKKRKT